MSENTGKEGPEGAKSMENITECGLWTQPHASSSGNPETHSHHEYPEAEAIEEWTGPSGGFIAVSSLKIHIFKKILFPPGKENLLACFDFLSKPALGRL